MNGGLGGKDKKGDRLRNIALLIEIERSLRE